MPSISSSQSVDYVNHTVYKAMRPVAPTSAHEIDNHLLCEEFSPILVRILTERPM